MTTLVGLTLWISLSDWDGGGGAAENNDKELV